MLYAIIAVIIMIADQWLKYWVTVNITLSTGSVPLIPGVVKLVNIHNQGAAFGFLDGSEYARWIFLGIAAVFIIAMIIMLAKKTFESKLTRWCAVMALAGAAGNCIDRIFYGYVVDMFKVEFMNFAVFNVADCFLVIACVLFIIAMIVEIFTKSGKDESEPKKAKKSKKKDKKADKKSDKKAEKKSEKKTEKKTEPEAEAKAEEKVVETAEVKSEEPVFPAHSRPVVTERSSEIESNNAFWAAFNEERAAKAAAKAEPKPETKPEVKAQPAPKAPVKPAPKAEPAESFDLESILAEFKDD